MTPIWPFVTTRSPISSQVGLWKNLGPSGSGDVRWTVALTVCSALVDGEVRPVKLSDAFDLKSQLSVALVESIFRRAGYTLIPSRQTLIPPHLGRDDLPDFKAVPPGATAETESRAVKVRYRHQVRQYLTIDLRRGGKSFLAQAKQHWPGLVIVLVTDDPEPGHSCFEVVDLATWSPPDIPTLVDLFAHPGLDIYRANVDEHEALARRILAMFSIAGTHRNGESTAL